MCFYYDEYAEVWNEVDRKARKAHRCDECGGPISAGESYRYISWIDYDGLGQFKVCGKCHRVRRAIHDAEIAEGCAEDESWCPLGGLADAIGEHHEGYGLILRDPETGVATAAPEAAHLFPHLAGGVA
jgi:hypothetical protein